MQNGVATPSAPSDAPPNFKSPKVAKMENQLNGGSASAGGAAAAGRTIFDGKATVSDKVMQITVIEIKDGITVTGSFEDGEQATAQFKMVEVCGSLGVASDKSAEEVLTLLIPRLRLVARTFNIASASATPEAPTTGSSPEKAPRVKQALADANEMEAAAIKMQAAARGHAQRKAMSESKVAATGKGKAALAEDAAAAEKEADADFVKTDVSMNVIMGVQGEKITGVTVKVFINVGQGVRLVADAENIPAERSVVDQPNLKVMPKWKRDTEGGARWYESLVAELAVYNQPGVGHTIVWLDDYQDEVQAALKLQAAVRGHAVRKGKRAVAATATDSGTKGGKEPDYTEEVEKSGQKVTISVFLDDREGNGKGITICAKDTAGKDYELFLPNIRIMPSWKREISGESWYKSIVGECEFKKAEDGEGFVLTAFEEE